MFYYKKEFMITKTVKHIKYFFLQVVSNGSSGCEILCKIEYIKEPLIWELLKRFLFLFTV